MKVADKEEYLVVLDDNGNPRGGVELRSVVHKNKLFHNEVALWIIDKENKRVLVQRRSPNKQQNPNKIALCAGHVVGYDTIENSLITEAKEELGIDLLKYNFEKLITIKRTEPNNYCFSHHFYIIDNIPIENFKIQKEELTEVFYIDYLKLKNMVMENNEEVVFKWNDAYKEVFKKLDEIIL